MLPNNQRFKVSPWLCLGALSLALMIVALPGGSRSAAIAQTAITERSQTHRDILQAIATAQVVYLGETHDDPADHTAQLEIVQALAQQNEVAIALEMFQRPFQPVLDAYLAGTLTEVELIAQSEYDTRWAFPWEFYAPILRYAKANQIPLIALNTPAEVTRQVVRTGLASLTDADLQYIPPLADIDTTNQAYRDWIGAAFSAHGSDHGLDFDNFFAAQVLWDETMAEGIVEQLATDPNRQVIVLAGEGHIAYGYGIPSRVARCLPATTQATLMLIPAAEAPEPNAADFWWPTSNF
ncbi:ChaN family lipoprotein [soil metagenome]